VVPAGRPPTQYQSSAPASGDAAAFCVVPAWIPVTPLKVGAPPARSVALCTFSMSTRHVSPAAVVADRVIGDVAAEDRARIVEPRLWAIYCATALKVPVGGAIVTLARTVTGGNGTSTLDPSTIQTGIVNQS
jgi:hypothetical protein